MSSVVLETHSAPELPDIPPEVLTTTVVADTDLPLAVKKEMLPSREEIFLLEAWRRARVRESQLNYRPANKPKRPIVIQEATSEKEIRPLMPKDYSSAQLAISSLEKQNGYIRPQSLYY